MVEQGRLSDGGVWGKRRCDLLGNLKAGGQAITPLCISTGAAILRSNGAVPMFSMARIDPILIREIPVIQQIIRDETWLEGERRGCAVTPDDQVVRENVCRVILRIGQQLRDSIEAQLARQAADVPRDLAA